MDFSEITWDILG